MISIIWFLLLLDSSDVSFNVISSIYFNRELNTTSGCLGHIKTAGGTQGTNALSGPSPPYMCVQSSCVDRL